MYFIVFSVYLISVSYLLRRLFISDSGSISCETSTGKQTIQHVQQKQLPVTTELLLNIYFGLIGLISFMEAKVGMLQ